MDHDQPCSAQNYCLILNKHNAPLTLNHQSWILISQKDLIKTASCLLKGNIHPCFKIFKFLEHPYHSCLNKTLYIYSAVIDVNRFDKGQKTHKNTHTQHALIWQHINISTKSSLIHHSNRLHTYFSTKLISPSSLHDGLQTSSLISLTPVLIVCSEIIQRSSFASSV